MPEYGPTLAISQETKRCWSCKLTLHILDFHKNADKCKTCAKDYAKRYREANKEKCLQSSKKAYAKNRQHHLAKVEEKRLQRQYGLSLEAYSELFIAHDNSCAICGVSSGEGLAKLVVDHCHKTGKVRGLLCRLCNTSLGGFKDDVDILKRAAQYLEKNNG